MKSIVKQALARLACGRLSAMKKADYYASTLLEMSVEVVDVPNVPNVTMGITRGLVLYVNGQWLLTDPEVQDDAVVGGCLIHECEHPLRGLDRLDVLPNKVQANIAGDEAINWNLREEGWPLPSWVIYPDLYGHPGGLTLESYYALLQKQMEQKQKTLQQMMDELTSKQGDGQSPWTPKIGSGGCGSAGGNAVDDVLEKELDAAYGKSSSEVESARQQTLDAIEDALHGPGCGSVPGRFKQAIKDRYKKPEINWRQLYQHVFRRALHIVSGASDYSLRRPSIGSQLVGYIGPGLIDQELNVVVIEDTSASMGTSQLVQARGEAYQLMKKMGLDQVTLIQIDAKVQHVQQVRLRNLPRIDYHGRGGTNFIPAFEYIQKHLPRTNLVAVFTDGDGPAPKKAPRGFETVWCIVRTPRARKPAHWGQTIVCDKDQKLLPPY